MAWTGSNGHEVRLIVNCCCTNKNWLDLMRHPHKESIVQPHETTRTNRPRTCIDNKERREWSLFFTSHYSRTIWPIKKWLIHVNSHKLLHRAPLKMKKTSLGLSRPVTPGRQMLRGRHKMFLNMQQWHLTTVKHILMDHSHIELFPIKVTPVSNIKTILKLSPPRTTQQNCSFPAPNCIESK